MLCKGANRWVILTRKWAIKIPNPSSWQSFLFGLLNNMNETRRSRRGNPYLCPVRLSCPGGFLIVMPRVTPVVIEHAACKKLCEDHLIPAEHKPESFGLLNGKIVAIDYGW